MMMWYYDTVSGKWHWWPGTTPPNNGDKAYCGHVFDNNCSQQGTTQANRCTTCRTNGVKS
jgi:hypothetical protein